MPYWVLALWFLLSSTVLLRFLGKKALAKISVAEVVVMIALGRILVEPLLSKSPWVSTYVGALLVAGSVLLSLVQIHVPATRRWISGEPLRLIKDGRVLPHNLYRAHMTVDQLKMHLRAERIAEIAQVKTATLEHSGALGIELAPAHAPATRKDIEELKQLLGALAERLQIPVNGEAWPPEPGENLFSQASSAQERDPLH